MNREKKTGKTEEEGDVWYTDIPWNFKTIIYRLIHSRMIYMHPGEWLIAKY